MKALLAAALLLAPAASWADDPGEGWHGNAGLIVRNIMERLAARSDEWFHQGAYLRSIQAFRMLTAYDPSDLQPRFLAAWLLWSAGRDDEAQETFRQAVLAAPDSWEPYLEAGQHWSGRRDHLRAALWLSHACLRGAPVQGWKTLAHTYRKLGLFEDAIRVMEQAREMDPSDETIPRNLDLLRRMLEQQERGEPPADR